MSKILRRPMFRGGPVNSEGTGITFGLDEGYATGGSVIPKRGLVDGPGGYAGDDIFGSEFEKGADIYSQTEREKGSLLSDLLESGSIEKKQQEAIDQLNKEAESYKKYKSPMGWGPQPGADKRFGGVRPDISESIYVQDAINKAKYAETPEGQNKILQNLLAQQRQQAEKYTQLYGTKGEKSPFVQNILNKGKGGEDDNLVNRELKNQNEISMDDIEARTEKYAKLLGYDKAKTQSIYDAMLAASPAFFKGRSFGETASGVLEAVNKSGAFDKPTNIKQAAAQLSIQREILMDKAKAEAQAKMAELGYKKPTTLGERYTAYVKGGTDPEMAKEFAVRETHGDAYKPYKYNPETAKPGEIYKIPKDPKNQKGPSQYVIILDPNKRGSGYEFKPLI